MHVARLRLAALIAGVLAAGPASAFSITVRPNLAAYQDTLVPAGGQVDPTAASSTTYIDEMVATVSTIACATGATPGTCKAYAPAGSTVVLQWTSANANTVFAGWTGCNSAVGTTCTVNLTTSNRAVTANFKPATYEVAAKTYPAATATWTPPYGGSLATVAAGIDCRTGAAVTDCSGSAPSGAAVVLTASPDGGSRVKSWSGCIPAAPNATTCTLIAFGPTAVAVAFEGEPTGPQLVTAQVSGTGTVTSGTSGQTSYMNCKDGRLGVSDCSAFAAYGTNLVLTAVPPSGGKLAGWSGCTTTSGLTCTVANVTAARAVSAAFKSATCNACHGLPPQSHLRFGTASECGNCHAGYTSSSVNLATHANGTVNVNPVVGLQPDPATDGFNVAIQSATLAAGQHPVIRAQFTNDAGQPLDMAAYWSGYQFRSGWTSTGSAATPRVGIVRMNADGTFNQMLEPTLASTTASSSETLATSGSQFVQVSPGVYDITLAYYMANQADSTDTTIPNPRKLFDPNQTYRVLVFGGRYGGAARNVLFAGNATYDVPPASGPAVTHNYLANGACAACHQKFKLGFHGDTRYSQDACKFCHLDGYGASGKVYPLSDGSPNKHVSDMGYQNFVHRLHGGKSMYDPLTFDPADLTTHIRHDFSEVKMAPSHKLYFEASAAAGTGTALIAAIDPELTIDCTVCHGTNDVWYTKPSRKACGSCHSDVNFDTGAGHSANNYAMADDTLCAACHQPTGNIPAIQAVHGKFYEPGHKYDFRPVVNNTGHDFRVTLQNVTAGADGKPTFTVQVTLNGSPYDIKAGVAVLANTVGGRVASCAFQIAGPTSDYTIGTPTGQATVGSTAQSCAYVATAPNQWTAVDAASGIYSFTAASAGTFFAGKPAGYYTAAFEIMYTQQAVATNTDIVRKPFSANPNFLTVRWDGTSASVVTGAEETLNKRRNVVEFAKCNACHQDLGFHSNRNRKGPDYCATCHNPKLDNSGRARYPVAEAELATSWDPTYSSSLVYLPESVSLNVFIHRIHMGSKLPSVSGKELIRAGTPAAAVASKWVQVPGVIEYGATRSAYVGVTATTPPSISDFSEFTMPNPMGRCDQCHISNGATQTWALNQGTGLAPIERVFRLCSPTTPSWSGGVEWCNNTSNGGPPPLLKSGQAATVVTPPLKAVCTSCHDSAATNAHADIFTVGPMTRTATEMCADCHGAGKVFDSLDVHKKIP